MRFSILSAIIATAAAAPTPGLLDGLFGSSSSSPAVDTPTAGGSCAGVTGPFKIQANVPGNTKLNGRYALAGPNTYEMSVVFGASSTRANEYSLDGEGHLIENLSGKSVAVYENGGPNTGTVTIAPSGKTQELICSINAASCALNCKAGTQDYNCLSSPKYQPDWRIATEEEASKPACVPFTPIVIPG